MAYVSYIEVTMAHVTRRQDDIPQEQVPAKGAVTAGTTRAIRKKLMHEGAGKMGAGITTAAKRRHAGTAEVPAKQHQVFVSGTAESFRGRAFRALLLHDPVVARAVAELVARGAVTGTRSKKISTRVDPGLMAAAKQRFGLASEADVINASLAVAAAPDRFKDWLRNPQHTLTDDFELAV